MGMAGVKRDSRIRRRGRRCRRFMNILVAMVAAAIAGCAFGIILASVSRAGKRARDERGAQRQYQNKTGGATIPHPEKILIRSPFPLKITPTREVDKYASTKKGNCSVAQELWEEVRVLCWVMTRPENHATKAAAVKETWGKRCNSLIFVSSKADSNLPTVSVPVKEGRYKLWGKTRAAFKYLDKKGYLNGDLHWVIKADDDTFVVMENLRYLLTHYDPSKTVYLGLHFKKRLKQGFMSGGTGYVLSRTAAKRLVTEGLAGNNTCRDSDQRYEDVEMGRCMAALGAEFVDTTESDGKHRFFPYQPERHLNAQGDPKLKWLQDYLHSPMSKGTDCCSRLAISFHYVSPSRMREMYYLVYHLTPYGIRNINDTMDQVTHDSNTASETLDVDAC